MFTLKAVKFILVFVPAVFLSCISWSADNIQRTITVHGDAEVMVVPEEVVITVGVETSNKVLNTAKNENDRIVRNVIAAAKKQNVDQKYIQTDYFTIEPRYEYQYDEKIHRDRQIFAGYFARKNVVVTLKDISRYEDLLGSILESGVNYVQGIQFKAPELRKYRDQARVMAIKAAKEKAELLAGELGVKVGKPNAINEDYGGMYSWYNNSWWGGRQNQPQAQNAMANAGSAYGNPPDDSSIAPGQISVSARVSVVFDLE